MAGNGNASGRSPEVHGVPPNVIWAEMVALHPRRTKAKVVERNRFMLGVSVIGVNQVVVMTLELKDCGSMWRASEG